MPRQSPELIREVILKLATREPVHQLGFGDPLAQVAGLSRHMKIGDRPDAGHVKRHLDQTSGQQRRGCCRRQGRLKRPSEDATSPRSAYCAQPAPRRRGASRSRLAYSIPADRVLPRFRARIVGRHQPSARHEQPQRFSEEIRQVHDVVQHAVRRDDIIRPRCRNGINIPEQIFAARHPGPLLGPAAIQHGLARIQQRDLPHGVSA